MPKTENPRLSSSRITWLPIKPAAPVTKTLISRTASRALRKSGTTIKIKMNVQEANHDFSLNESRAACLQHKHDDSFGISKTILIHVRSRVSDWIQTCRLGTWGPDAKSITDAENRKYCSHRRVNYAHAVATSNQQQIVSTSTRVIFLTVILWMNSQNQRGIQHSQCIAFLFIWLQ